MPPKAVIITIDGPAGAGKSSVAKRLAKQLNFAYLDTGAMYRALTLKSLRQKINLEDENALVAMSKQTFLDLKEDAQTGLRVFLDGKDVSNEIRSYDVTNHTFYIARAPGVRKVMVEWQREIAVKRNVVVEGRDIGTVVFPKANFKFYLDADFNERSRRRIEELRAKGETVDAAVLKLALKDRDTKDLTRKVGPLKKAADAVYIDSTHLTIDDTVKEIMKHVHVEEKHIAQDGKTKTKREKQHKKSTPARVKKRK